MNEFTREELEQIADTDHVQCGEASALARRALAAMDSEPVAWIVHARTGDQLTTDGGYVANAEGILGLHSTPLYRHAQPAQTGVDDDVRNIIGLLETNEWAEHCTETVLGSRLEAEITRLVGSSQPAPVTPDGSEDTKRLDWLDAQNKRLNEYYGTSYGWKFDANFQRNAMMLNDSNYPVMTVRQAIDEAIAEAKKRENI